MNQKNNVKINQTILVSTGKSSRLTALSNKAKSQCFNLDARDRKVNSQRETKLKLDAEIALLQANKLIEQSIGSILENYPVGKKKSLFKLRYGTELDQVKVMSVKDVFILLRLQKTTIQHFSLIQNLDSNGNSVVE